MTNTDEDKNNKKNEKQQDQVGPELSQAQHSLG